MAITICTGLGQPHPPPPTVPPHHRTDPRRTRAHTPPPPQHRTPDPGPPRAARDAARVALAETRRAGLGLGPALLELHSLDALAAELGWARSTSGLCTDLVVTVEPVRLTPDVDQRALRLV